VTDHDLGRLAALVENRLDAAERRAVMAHLADCRDCRTVVAGLARATTDAALDSRQRTSWTPARVWLSIAASALVVIGAGWLYSARTSRPPVPADPVTVSLVPSSPPPTNPPTTAPPADPGLTRRSGEREVANRRFRLEAGTWIDVAYDPFKLLPAVDIRTVSERDALIARLPALQPFLVLGAKFTVVYNSTVYRFDLPR